MNYMKIDVTEISSVIRLDSDAARSHLEEIGSLIDIKTDRVDQFEQYVFDSAGHKWILSAYAHAGKPQMFLFCDNGDSYDDKTSNAVEIFGYLNLLELTKNVLETVSVKCQTPEEHQTCYNHYKDDEHVMRTLERCV